MERENDEMIKCCISIPKSYIVQTDKDLLFEVKHVKDRHDDEVWDLAERRKVKIFQICYIYTLGKKKIVVLE